MSRTQKPEAARDGVIAAVVAADFGEGSPRSRAALMRRVAETPDGEQIHHDLMRLWDDLGQLDEPDMAEPEPGNAHGRREALPIMSWRVAASVIPLLLMAGILLFTFRGSFGPSVEDIRTASNERRIVTLSDGSTVSLSPDSALSVTMTGSERSLVLRQGEGLFDVAPDPARPFVVQAGNGSVRAVGTAFNVRVGPDVVVTVVEGTVSVAAGKARAASPDRPLTQIASAGQQVRFGAHSTSPAAASQQDFITPPQPVDPDRFTSWTSGVLRFDGEPLAVVINELNRYSARKIRLTDPSLADKPIYGVFHIGDVEGLRSIVRDLERNDDANVSEALFVQRAR